MKVGTELPAVSGAWEATLLRLKKEGARSALVYAESEVRQMADAGQLNEAKCLCRRVVSLSNRKAATLSFPDNVWVLRCAKAVLEYVQRCCSAEEPDSLFRLHLVTCNNLALVLKRLGDTEQALSAVGCTLRAILTRRTKPSTGSLQYIASTKVNMSTLLLDLKQYKEAIVYAEECLNLLQTCLSQTSLSLKRLEQKNAQEHRAMLQSYLSALFNIALAEEGLHRRSEAIRSYQTCIEFAQKYVPDSSTILADAQAALGELLQPVSEKPSQESSTPLRLSMRATQLEDGFGEGPKYYSRDRLKSLHQQITMGNNRLFVSSNEFFHAKVSQTLKLDEDVRCLTPVSLKQLTKSMRASRSVTPDSEQRSLSQLRERRYKKSASKSGDSQGRGLDYIQARLSSLQQMEDDGRSQTARQIRVAEIRRSEASPPRSLLDRKRVVRTPPAPVPPTRLKSEIEELMVELQNDINSLSPSKKSYRVRATSQLALSMRSKPQSLVLHSAEPVSKILTSLLVKGDSPKKSVVFALKRG